MTVLVDSDILIEVSRNRDTSIISTWRSLVESGTPLLYSPVSVAELWAGARPSEYGALSALFDAMTPIPIDPATGRMAGDFLRLYRNSHSVELADALIAACAISARALLWTRNRKHYPMKEITVYADPRKRNTRQHD